MKKLSVGQSVAGFLIGLLVLAIVGLAGYGGYVLVKDNLIKDNNPAQTKPEDNKGDQTTPEEDIAATAVAECMANN